MISLCPVLKPIAHFLYLHKLQSEKKITQIKKLEVSYGARVRSLALIPTISPYFAFSLSQIHKSRRSIHTNFIPKEPGQLFLFFCSCVETVTCYSGLAVVTCVGAVDAEALVPEAGDEQEAIIGWDEEALWAHLHALIQEIVDLSAMHQVTYCTHT